MSTTDDGDGETPSEEIELPQSARRLHELYLADLSRVEPVSDAQILAAIHRAELHDQDDHASRADIAAHLGLSQSHGMPTQTACSRWKPWADLGSPVQPRHRMAACHDAGPARIDPSLVGGSKPQPGPPSRLNRTDVRDSYSTSSRRRKSRR